ncbi:MAG TPA: glycosyltransferase [Rhizomicrobium sp.]|nr:glycosyltransferase [Rhizomicrobium sp.]
MSIEAFATVAICTHDRLPDVRRCLAGLVSQAKAEGLAVLVVDSGSSPECATGLSALANRWDIQILRCDEPGVSKARNVAATAAKTEWIIYLDDDALPAPDWAERIVQSLRECPADAGMIGGMIRPKWPDGSDPAKITERWKLLLSCTDRPGRGLVPDKYNICGANLAVRQSALAFAGGFPTNLGRIGTKLLSGEEAYLIAWFRWHNISVLYDDRFVVDHYIANERMNPRWAAQRAYWEGYSYLRILRALGARLPRSVWPLKLIASIPALALLAILSVDFRIRLGMALGSLAAQIEYSA